MRRPAPALVAAIAAWLLVTGCSGQAAQPREVVLSAVGDYAATPDTDAVLSTVASLSPDVHLALGDLSYGDLEPESAWCEYVRARVGDELPFALLSGNHDSLDVPDGDIDRFAECLPNRLPGLVGDYGREYRVDLPAGDPLVRVIGISPGLRFADGLWEYREGDPHYRWTLEAIEAARAQGIAWVVVAAHQPCLSVGVHSCPAVDDVYQMLIDQRVDVVLHAHEHSYARTFPLASSAGQCPAVAVDAFDRACVAATGTNYRAGSGTVFATVGGGGMPLRESDPQDPEAGYFASFNGSNIEPAHGLLRLQITTTEILGEFIPASGTRFTDTFRIAR